MDFIYKPDTWINGTVKVEITTSITGYTLQYSLDEGENWYNYTEEIPVTTNGKVILARLAEGERTGGIATGEVENIDTQAPKGFNLTTTAEATSITVSAEGMVEDADEIEGVSGKSGIRGYQFKLMNNDGTTKVDWTEEQPAPSYTFNTGLTAGTTYKVSMKAIDNAENPTEAINGADGTAIVTTEVASIPTTKSYVGYYADLNPNDGKIDGIIFADQAVGGSGQWGTETYGYAAYTIPVKTGLKEYYESQESYTVEGFGTKEVLTPKAGSTGEDRFYIMALEDTRTTKCAWYNAADGKMTDYAEATSVEFGTGRANTTKMIEYWNNKTYGEQNTETNGKKDIWGEIQGEVAEGWFVPSRAEWAAFAQELGITKTNYGDYGLSRSYWSSSQVDTRCASVVNFVFGDTGGYATGNWSSVRLCATF